MYETIYGINNHHILEIKYTQIIRSFYSSVDLQFVATLLHNNKINNKFSHFFIAVEHGLIIQL